MQARRSCVTPLLCDAGAVHVVAVLKLQTPVPLASASLGVLCCHHLTSLDPSTTSNGVEIIMEYYHFRMLDRPCCNIHTRARAHTHTHLGYWHRSGVHRKNWRQGSRGKSGGATMTKPSR